MILARVEGSLVATKKTEGMTGCKMLLVRPMVVTSADQPELEAGRNSLVAVDQLGAGEGDLVLIAQGSSARLGMTQKNSPVDAIVLGIVDTVDVKKKIIYRTDE